LRFERLRFEQPVLGPEARNEKEIAKVVGDDRGIKFESQSRDLEVITSDADLLTDVGVVFAWQARESHQVFVES